MRVLQVTSELFPLVKTGGLADATAGLAHALARLGDDVRVLLPNYPGCADATDARPWIELGDPLGAGPTRLLAGRSPSGDVGVWLVDCPRLFDRPGGPYLDAHGVDWPDNHRRFALLARVAATLAVFGAAIGWAPDVVHAHDWQSGLVPAYLAWWGGRHPATVFTVHNLAFSGSFPPDHLPAVGLPWSAYAMHGVELYGSFSFLKAGLYYARTLTTVSPTYALEIQTPLGGEGLHGLLAARDPDLHGILNGIDVEHWDPAADPDLGRPYGPASLPAKAEAKVALQRELGLRPDPRALLFGSVGRMTGQKGLDLVLAALPRILADDGQLALLGSGEPAIEAEVQSAARRWPGRVAFHRGYNEPLSHRLMAGADTLLVPSRFEPCGLTQMYAMRYGTPPLVRRTGGLADTVTDADERPDGVGFCFDEPTPAALVIAMDRLREAFADPGRWAAIQRRAMARDFAWTASARRYRALYRPE